MLRNGPIRGTSSHPVSDIKQEINELFPKRNPLARVEIPAMTFDEKKRQIDDVRSLFSPVYKEIIVKKKSKNCRKTTGKILYGTYTGSLLLAASAADTITFTLGLMMQEKNFLGFIKKTDERIYGLTAFYLAQCIVITTPYVNQGMKDAIEVIKYRAIPLDWSQLPRNQEIIAAVLALTCAAYSVTGEVTATHGFWKDLGVPAAIAGVLAAMYGKTCLLSESHKAWENIRNIFVFFNKGAHCGSLSFTPAKSLGYLLALFSAAGAMILGYDGITDQLDIDNFGLKIFLLVFALSKGFTDISLNGKINVDALNELAGQSPTSESKEEAPPASKLFKAVAGIGSLTFGTIVAESLAMIYIDSLATAALPFSMPTDVPPVLGYGIAVSQGTNVAYGTYEFLDILRKKMHSLIGRCRNREKKETADDFDIEMPLAPVSIKKVGEDVYIKLPGKESKDPSPYSTGNPNLTFATAKTVKLPSLPIDKTPVPSDKSRCVIL